MSKTELPLTAEDFWEDHSIETESRIYSTAWTCPRCGALIMDLLKHIEFHNE